MEPIILPAIVDRLDAVQHAEVGRPPAYREELSPLKEDTEENNPFQDEDDDDSEVAPDPVSASPRADAEEDFHVLADDFEDHDRDDDSHIDDATCSEEGSV